MLVPYYAFKIGSVDNEAMALDHVYVSLTSKMEPSMT